MATKIFRINSAIDAKNFAQSFVRGIAKPVKNAKGYFEILGTLIDQDTRATFRNEGARSGMSKWPGFKTKIGTRRPGTDNSKTRVRTPADRLLQASGGYASSFGKPRGIYSVSSTRLEYGTNITGKGGRLLAGLIGANPFRPVLFVTDGDVIRYQNRFKKWIDQGIKF